MRRLSERHTDEKNYRFTFLLSLILVLVLSLSACGDAPGTEKLSVLKSEIGDNQETKQIQETKQTQETEAIQQSGQETVRARKSEPEQTEAENKDLSGDSSFVEELVNSFESDSPFAIPEYSGESYVVMNGNIPFFTRTDLPTESFEYYSELDRLGRCGAACANVGQDIMPTEERGSIGQVKPSGWHTVKYDNVDGNYLYNRCHLIGYQLSAENANEKNLITGTRYLNVEGMLPFENMTADYVKETANHVLYRVTPVFEGDDLLARGVLMEGWSVEDGGEGVCFNVFVYNVQPDIVIDYASGESHCSDTYREGGHHSEDDHHNEGSHHSEYVPTASEPDLPEVQSEAQNEEPNAQEYMLNTNTHKFHYPDCGSVKQMAEKNKKLYSGSRDEVISMGYDPCKKCNP